MVSMGWLITGGLVASRLSGAMMVMPAIGLQGVPGLVRILCAIALTVSLLRLFHKTQSC